MTKYKLAHDLPTFEKGEMFVLDDDGNLRRESDGLVAYMRSTIEKFPDILTKWFVPTVRDGLTKEAFKKYLDEYPNQRFFQAVRNFARDYLGDEFNFIYASKRPLENYVQHYDKFQDTYPFECDAIHEILKEDNEEELSDEAMDDEVERRKNDGAQNNQKNNSTA